ncbi:ParB/RepB/Spo0J family partition protein [Magnetofaba australis]|nr:ParB/RepB/Spo0J family partition protein [Magnetofaba australis]
MGDEQKLGRGLESLLNSDSAEEKQRIRYIRVDSIAPNPWQPRKQFDSESLAELVSSIKEQGVLQPIIVRKANSSKKSDTQYELIAGERRWRASSEAGLEEIPAIVKEWDDSRTLEVALLENIQRQDLSALETARGYERLIQEFNYSHAEIAERIGLSRTAVSNLLRLLKLPSAAIELLEEGMISAGHARALLGYGEDSRRIIEVANQIVQDELSVRDVEQIVREDLEKNAEESSDKKAKTKKKPKESGLDPSIASIVEEMTSYLDKSVKLTKKRNQMVLEISLKDEAELQEFREKLIK